MAMQQEERLVIGLGTSTHNNPEIPAVNSYKVLSSHSNKRQSLLSNGQVPLSNPLSGNFIKSEKLTSVAM